MVTSRASAGEEPHLHATDVWTLRQGPANPVIWTRFASLLLPSTHLCQVFHPFCNREHQDNITIKTSVAASKQPGCLRSRSGSVQQWAWSGSVDTDHHRTASRSPQPPDANRQTTRTRCCSYARAFRQRLRLLLSLHPPYWHAECCYPLQALPTLIISLMYTYHVIPRSFSAESCAHARDDVGCVASAGSVLELCYM